MVNWLYSNFGARCLYYRDDAPTPVSSKPKGARKSAASLVIELRVIGTPDVIQMQVRDSMILGRSDADTSSQPDLDLEPYNAYRLGVSRQHAEITVGSYVSVRDLHSANGTFVNGERLLPERDYRLQHGDHLQLGNLQFQVRFVLTPKGKGTDTTPYAKLTIPVFGSGQHVLVVDHDEKIATAMGDVLEQAGFTVTITDTVTDALTLIEEHLPDAIVLELLLPDRHGLELIHYVRKQMDAYELPIIVVSNISGGQAISAGADFSLTKPIGMEEFIRNFRNIVAQTRR